MAKVGILGSGNVAKALARGFVSRGHAVTMGTRDATKLADFVKEQGGKVSVGNFADAASFGDIVVLATQGAATKSAIDLAGPSHFAGKVVIDTTNPLAPAANGPPSFFVGTTDSLGEQVQRWLPGAKVVKAFNSVGNPHMVDPKLPGGPPDMFIAGDDEGARKRVAEICASFGWGVIDLGGIAASRWIEPLCMVWVLHGMQSKSWSHALKMLR